MPIAHFDVSLDGERVVLDAPDVIYLNVDAASRMLRQFGANTDIEVQPDGTVVLDDAGEHRYRLVRMDRQRPGVGIYERIQA